MAEPTETETDAAQAPVPDTVDSASTATAVDLSNRPDTAWLDQVEGDIDDVDLVLKCLARNSTSMCGTCNDLAAAGDLESRAVLAHCASSKTAK